jgi:hypothetical protein
MRKLYGAVIGGLLALSLTACEGAVTSQSYVHPAFGLGSLSGIASQGGLPVEILGTPFAGREAEVAAAVEHAFTTYHYGARWTAYSDPPDELSRLHRAVVIFNPALSANYDRACRDPNEPHDPVGGPEVRLMAVFCIGGITSTATFGRMQGISGPEDPQFADLLRQVSLALFPSPAPRGDRTNPVWVP